MSAAEFVRRANEYAQRVVRAAAEGPLVDIALDPLALPGKGVRARLVAEVGAVLGVPSGELLPAAAAAELLHNASLVHDDVQDGDTVRRGHPTVWARHGVPQAINAGDLLLMVSVAAVDTPDYSVERRWWLARALMRRSSATVGGQALELALSHHADILPSMALYLRAAIGKTGHFFALPVELACLVAGLSPEHAQRLGDAALPLGAIYQIADDLLDLYGDKGRGARGNDVREGKVSALVALHLDCRPSDRAWLTEVLRRPRELTTEHDVERAARAFVASGAARHAVAAAFQARDQLAAMARAAQSVEDAAVTAVLVAVAERLCEPLTQILAPCDPIPMERHTL